MGRRLRRFINTIKDTATLTTATLSPTTTSATLAVLRATPHHPSTSPPSPHHLSTLLSFGHNSRLSASSLLSALSHRLRTSSDLVVSLKSLLALHHLLSHAPFILHDHLLNLPPNSFHLSPLPFPSSSDTWPLSPWLLFLSRLLHLRITAASVISDDDLITSLLNQDLILELEALVGVVEEIARAPAMTGVENNGLIAEVVKLVMAVRVAAEERILCRVRELGLRFGSIGFADSIELVWLLKRLKECRSRPFDWKSCENDWLWAEVKRLLDQVECVVVEKEEEERKRRISRDKVCGSERIVSRDLSGSDLTIRFGSSRWGVY